MIAEIELRNQKQWWPSFSLRVVGESKNRPAQILTQPVFFPYIPRMSAQRQKVELQFPRRGLYRQDSFGIRTRFPFGFFEKTRLVSSDIQIVVYPRVEAADQFYEVLPLLSGEMASYFRGRGHELHSLRAYLPSDSAFRSIGRLPPEPGHLMVREFAREDERRVMLVLDPFLGPPRAELGQLAAAEQEERFERAVTMAASIAWHFEEIGSVMQFRTDRFSTPMAPAGRDYRTTRVRELAPFIKPGTSSVGGAFLDELAGKAAKSLRSFSPAARNEPFPQRCGPRPTSSSSKRCNVPLCARIRPARHGLKPLSLRIFIYCAPNSPPRSPDPFSAPLARVVSRPPHAICRAPGTAIPIASWVAEVMLQQARIAAVIPYYDRFLRRFPDMEALARAQQEEVLKLWSGLRLWPIGREICT